MDDYAQGFEHAIRNIVLSLEKQIKSEDHPDRRLGLEVALDRAKSYHGFMSGGETLTVEQVRAKQIESKANRASKQPA